METLNPVGRACGAEVGLLRTLTTCGVDGCQCGVCVVRMVGVHHQQTYWMDVMANSGDFIGY